MIGLVGLRASCSIPGVDVLGGLPPPPATAWSAFLVGLGSTVSLEDVLLWAAPVRRVRPFLPVGIVGDLRQRDTKVLDAMSAVGLAKLAGGIPIPPWMPLNSESFPSAWDAPRPQAARRFSVGDAP